MKRPVLVTVIGVLAILGGIAQAAFGGLLMTLRNDAQFLSDSKMTTDKVTYLAVGCMVVGVLTVLFAVGLLKGSRVSRDLIGLMELLQLGVGIYIVVALDASHRSTAFGNIAGSLVVLYFLFGTQKAKAFFAKSSTVPSPSTSISARA
ncbi:MAG: hypothetical protein RJA49_1533 [Actinomycetota bacterium]|jgi:hypothetical protein